MDRFKKITRRITRRLLQKSDSNSDEEKLSLKRDKSLDEGTRRIIADIRKSAVYGVVAYEEERDEFEKKSLEAKRKKRKQRQGSAADALILSRIQVDSYRVANKQYVHVNFGANVTAHIHALDPITRRYSRKKVESRQTEFYENGRLLA